LLLGGNWGRANAANLHGTAIAGIANSIAFPNGELFLWSGLGGIVGLGALSGATSAGGVSISLDGSVIVGTCTFPGRTEAFRWTSVTGMIGLGGFPGQSAYSQGEAVNGDGTIVVGGSQMGGVFQPFRWTAANGMVALPILPGATGGGAKDVSSNGDVIVGLTFGAQSEAFRWTPSTGTVGLGDLPGGPFQSSARGVSDSGLVVVGQGRSAAGMQAVFWPPGQGPMRVADYLDALGVTTHHGWYLDMAESVSADGLRIVGHGINPLGQDQAWLAVFPDPWTPYCTAKANSLGCHPAISADGVPSASNVWSFVVRATDVLNQTAGLFFYKVGGSSAAVPFQGGTLCVGPSGIRRTPVVFSGGNPAPANDCSGVYEFDFNAFAAGLAGGNPDPALLSVGSIYRCQAWGRDQGFSPPNNTSLSNALQVPIGP
jgi:uncharacterized membrane protein